MNSDARNQALVGSSDGTPLFKDKNARNGMPYLLRNATLADELWMNSSLAHMVAYTPHDYITWKKNKPTKVFRQNGFVRVVRIYYHKYIFRA